MELKITHGLSQYFWGTFKHPIVTKIVLHAASMNDDISFGKTIRANKCLLGLVISVFAKSSIASKLKDISGRDDIVLVCDPVFTLGK